MVILACHCPAHLVTLSSAAAALISCKHAAFDSNTRLNLPKSRVSGLVQSKLPVYPAALICGGTFIKRLGPRQASSVAIEAEILWDIVASNVFPADFALGSHRICKLDILPGLKAGDSCGAQARH